MSATVLNPLGTVLLLAAGGFALTLPSWLPAAPPTHRALLSASGHSHRRAAGREYDPRVSQDPVATNPTLYRVVMENEHVRVLEYRDRPGDRTTPHWHPDSVMITLSDFDRRLHDGDRHTDVVLQSGLTRWLPSQVHAGENIGTTETHVMFVELKHRDGATPGSASLGPDTPDRARD